MKTPQPLELAGRMLRRSTALFRQLGHPGYALLTDVGGEAVGNAQAMATTAEADDRKATALLDEVLADGIVTKPEIRKLVHARRHVRRSAALDHALAAGGAR